MRKATAGQMAEESPTEVVAFKLRPERGRNLEKQHSRQRAQYVQRA